MMLRVVIAALLIALLLTLGWLVPVSAAWQYVMIDPNGETTYYDAPPVDLTYPPPGEPTPMMEISKGEAGHVKVLTPEEIRERARSPRLIIFETKLASGQETLPIGHPAEGYDAGVANPHTGSAASPYFGSFGRTCTIGKPCGNTCIDIDKECHVRPGTAHY